MNCNVLFWEMLPAWLSGIAAIVAIIIACISNYKSNKLQKSIADDNSNLLKEIQFRDANMKLYDLRLEVYTTFMRALDVESRILEAERKRPIVQSQVTTELLNELTDSKAQIKKVANIALFCFSGDADILQAIDKAKDPFIIFCDEILKNMQASKDMAYTIGKNMIRKDPLNAQKILLDIVECNTNSQFYQEHQQNISELGKRADQALEEYKMAVSYDNFGKLFEKYLLPEAITIYREPYGN